MSITLREFRPEDAADFSGEIRGDQIIGLTACIGDQVAGYAGIRDVHGRAWAFYCILDDRARRPFLVHRTTMAVLTIAARAGIGPVYAFCDDALPRAEAWLKRLGFRLMTDNEKDQQIRMTEAAVNKLAWVRET